MSSYRDLKVWQNGTELSLEVYRLTSKLPQHELYGLTSQLRRAAVSVPSNIAEGQARKTEMEFARFLIIAKGSLAEIETQIIIATKFGIFRPIRDRQFITIDGSREPHAKRITKFFT